jgi:O-antigen/teichoic acid export membrane protein
MTAAPPNRGASATAATSEAGGRLLAESVAYIAIDAAQNLLALLVLPASLWWLTPGDMGTVTLTIIGTQIAMAVVSVGLDFAVVRYYLTWPEVDRPGQIAGVLAIVASGAAIVITGAALLASAFDAYALLVLASVTAGAGLAIRAIPLAVFRVTSGLADYATIVISGSVLQAILQVGLLAMDAGLKGFLVGTSVAAWLSAAMALVFLIRAGKVAAVQRLGGATLRLGAWAFASTLLTRVVASADRFAVGWWGSMDALGVYGTAARWSMPLRMVSGGTKMAIAPALSRAESAVGSLDSASAIIAALMTILALLTGILQLSALSLLLTPWWSRIDEFQRLLSVLLAAQLGGCLTLIGQLVLYYGGRSGYSAGLSALSAAVTFGGLAWLVPRFGAVGAALSQLAASMVQLLALGLVSSRRGWLSSRSLRALAVSAAGLAGPWLLPLWGSAMVTVVGTGLLARWAWDDLRSTVRLRGFAR